MTNVRAIQPLPDGKILIGGDFDSVGGASRVFIARLNNDGSLDASFNAPLAAFDGESSGAVMAIVLQPDGKILVGGAFQLGLEIKVVVRLNANGSIDTAFNPNIVGDNNVRKILLQPNGKIFITGGLGFINGVVRSGIARLNADGTTDSFYPSPSGPNNLVFSIARQPHGKVLIGGTFTSVAGVSRLHLARLLDTITPTAFDFDGDGCADLSVFRASNQNWYFLRSSNSSFYQLQWGLSTDRLAPADYDGDGKTDVAVFRAGVWYVLSSASGSVNIVSWGLASDKPVPADYDGDGLADFAVYRSGNWWIRQSAFNSAGTQLFGLSGDEPLAAAFIR